MNPKAMSDAIKKKKSGFDLTIFIGESPSPNSMMVQDQEQEMFNDKMPPMKGKPTMSMSESEYGKEMKEGGGDVASPEQIGLAPEVNDKKEGFEMGDAMEENLSPGKLRKRVMNKMKG